MLTAILIANFLEICLLFTILIRQGGGEIDLKQIKINEDTFDALLTLAEKAVANEAAERAEVEALKAANANEEELDGDRKARVEALILPAPTTPASEPATETPA